MKRISIIFILIGALGLGGIVYSLNASVETIRPPFYQRILIQSKEPKGSLTPKEMEILTTVCSYKFMLDEDKEQVKNIESKWNEQTEDFKEYYKLAYSSMLRDRDASILDLKLMEDIDTSEYEGSPVPLHPSDIKIPPYNKTNLPITIEKTMYSDDKARILVNQFYTSIHYFYMALNSDKVSMLNKHIAKTNLSKARAIYVEYSNLKGLNMDSKTFNYIKLDQRSIIQHMQTTIDNIKDNSKKNKGLNEVKNCSINMYKFSRTGLRPEAWLEQSIN